MANENLWFYLVGRGHDKIGQKFWPATEGLIFQWNVKQYLLARSLFSHFIPSESIRKPEDFLGEGWEHRPARNVFNNCFLCYSDHI